jgi:hypothetical protein
MTATKLIANPWAVGRVTPCAPRLQPAGTGLFQMLFAIEGNLELGSAAQGAPHPNRNIQPESRS